MCDNYYTNQNIFIIKKIILIAAMALGFVVTAAAQPRAVGIRGGYGVEATYQHTLNETNFIEANLGLNGFDALNVAATYNWMLAQPQWTSRGDWGFYAGPGVAVGFDFNSATAGVNVGAVGQIGLEYTFWFPLQLSIDIRPQLGVHIGNGDLFHVSGFYPTLAARYRF